MRIQRAYQGIIFLVTEGYGHFLHSCDTANSILQHQGNIFPPVWHNCGHLSSASHSSPYFRSSICTAGPRALRAIGEIWANAAQAYLERQAVKTCLWFLRNSYNGGRGPSWRVYLEVHPHLDHVFTSLLSLDQPIDSIIEQGIILVDIAMSWRRGIWS